LHSTVDVMVSNFKLIFYFYKYKEMRVYSKRFVTVPHTDLKITGIICVITRGTR